MALETATDGMDDGSAAYLDMRLIGGSAVLVAGGLVVCLLGTTMGVLAVVGAYRRYVANLEESPWRLARRRLGQVRSATAASIEAWQEHDRQGRPDRAP